MQTRALTILSNLRIRKHDTADATHNYTRLSSISTTRSTPPTFHLFAFPCPSALTDSAQWRLLPPQPSPDGPISPLTLQHAPTMADVVERCARNKREIATVTILDVSTLKASANKELETAIIPRRQRGSLSYKEGEEEAKVANVWEEMVSPKTVDVASFGGLNGVVDVMEPGVALAGEMQMEAGRKRSWDEYDADDEDDDEWFDEEDFEDAEEHGMVEAMETKEAMLAMKATEAMDMV